MYRFDATISSAVEDSAFSSPEEAPVESPLSGDLLNGLQRYWQAANYLTVGQIYLRDNPLLHEPLRPEHIKPRLLGHWGTSPGLSLIYVHLTRLIRERDASVTTTPFQMVVMNEMSRFHLAADAIRRVPRLRDRAPQLIAQCEARIIEATTYAQEHFEDQT